MSGHPRGTTTTAPGTARSVMLVTQREILSKLRSKVFVISTAVLFLASLVTIVWGGLASQSAIPDTKVAVTAETASQVTAETADGIFHTPGIAVVEVATSDAAIARVRSGAADAALVPAAADASGFDFRIVAKEEAPAALLAALSRTPQVELLDHSSDDGLLRYLVAIGFGVVFLMAASMFGGTIAQSVVEEKQTRVVELLISAVPVRTLLAGKVLGNTVLAMAQIVGFAAIAAVGMAITHQTALLDGLGGPLALFALFFLFGFVLLASLFSAAGAMVSRQEDIGSTTTPLTLLILAPYILVIVFNDNPVVLTVLSYVPFSAPVAMPLRVYLGATQWWEPVVSLVILVASCAGAIWVGARIYRNSILRMGARVRLVEALAS